MRYYSLARGSYGIKCFILVLRLAIVAVSELQGTQGFI